MPAIRAIQRIPSFIWIPPLEDIESKVEIVTTTGITYDITDEILDGSYTDGVTDTIGNFFFVIDNNDDAFTDKFGLYDEVKIYSDYANTATTQRFTGLLEKVSPPDGDITISGRSVGSRPTEITVTLSTTNFTHEILSTILTTYASYVTQNNIDTTVSTDTSITVNWYQKPLWECVQELCFRAGYDAYIDYATDFHYFVSGSRDNTTEAVVHENNLEDVGDFTPDLTIVKNRVIVYGAIIEDMPIIWTEDDQDSIDLYDVRELIINDTNIATVDQAQARAQYELSLNKDPPIIGEVTSLGLATILPGERIRISDQESKLDPGFYDIIKFTQTFNSEDVPLTILTLKKESNSIPRILKRRIQSNSEDTAPDNPNEMKFSWLFTYDVDSGTHSSTQITGGVLKTDGGASGIWISPSNQVSSNATDCEIRVKGETIPGTDFFVSTDGGVTWQSITLNTLKTLAPPGANLRIKAELNSALTQIDSLVLLYKF